MPIYEYQCTNPKCGRLYDQLEPSSASTTQPCIDCGGLAERVLGVPAKGKMGNGKGNKPSKEQASYCPLCSSKGLGVVVEIAVPVPHHVAEALIKTEKMRRAAPNN